MGSKGFSLAEVLIAVATAGLILVALVGLFLLTSVSGTFGMNRARATQLAEAEMTRRKLGGYQSLLGLVGTAPAPVTRIEGDTEFVETTRVARVSSSPGSSDFPLLTITVQMEWKERRNLDIHEKKAGAGEGRGSLTLASVLAPEAQY